ncbi:hypothetical protein BZG36_00598 [Bifiguratus adelaidae]|uniref:Kinesin-like protein n=1 Tax=Bifiguratus adelaidae TaxID=1938954 RepID=A0A261Y721_9FUNG|nr:hypothetical protein BZG36_00598 [Bifiguratus adelaidae]
MLIRMDGNQTILSKPPDAQHGKGDDVKPFTFDKSYWSADKSDPSYASQEMVYNDLGEELLEHAFDGYNCCIFAYGQTGSGKSYSMMGYGEDKGIIPRTCMELFNRIERQTEQHLTFRVEVTYIEIYNEKVRDLLNPKNKGNLKVREHPSLGPYVEDLSRLVVNNFSDINHLMDEGNKARTVAATNMNETSSRSHAVFTVYLTQKRYDELTKLETEKVARISLVDLAGSERANSTGATGQRLKEGANINKSLTTLGKVIAGLAEQSMNEGKKGKRGKETFIPYRDSVLTWLLKDSLGGNSKTAMIAAISPADYEETLSTLRYADQAKKIKNKAVVNEDPNARLIRELKEELDQLRSKLMQYAPDEVEAMNLASAYHSNRLSIGQKPPANLKPSQSTSVKEITITDASGVTRKMTREEVIEQLQSSEKLLNELNQTWEEKLLKSAQIQKEREQALEELGIAVEKNVVGVYTPKKTPHLVNLNEDPLMSECLVYQIKPGVTKVGRLESDEPADIRLSGSNILDRHCFFENVDGVVTIHPAPGSQCMVNGIRTQEARRLRSGFRIILGDYHVFRFNNPEEVRKERDLQKTIHGDRSSMSLAGGLEYNEALDGYRPESPTASIPPSEVVDWNFAKREAVLTNYYGGQTALNGMKDEDLEKLFDDITKVWKLRKSGRPESRAADFDDDSESRTSSVSNRNGVFTDEGIESVFTDNTTLTHVDLEDKLKVAREELELQKQEYEEKLRLLDGGSVSGMDPAEVTLLEEQLQAVKDEMEKKMDQQKAEYEDTIKRMSSQLSLGKKDRDEDYSERTKKLLRRCIKTWRRQRRIHMAETILVNSILLKEANVISKELDKQVLYQFTIIDEGTLWNMYSFWESTAALAQFNQYEDTALLSSPKPTVAVHVIDRKNKVAYIWSLDKLKTRLQQMRNLYNYIDRPAVRKHFNWEDPFYESPCPRYTLIGTASLCLRNLLFQQSLETRIPIICQRTGKTKGQCTVAVTFISVTSGPSKDASDAASDGNIQVGLSVGQQLLFEISLVEITSLSEREFTQVHMQFKLSSLGIVQPHSHSEKIFATEPMSDFGNRPILFDYSQTLSVKVNQSMLKILESDCMKVEVFGSAKEKALSAIENWDDERESMSQPNGTNPLLARNDDSPKERHNDDELVTTERHDILAWIQICEPTPDGEYKPVNVLSNNTALDPGVFCLRQGLSRRIILTLSHNSGKQFPWSRVTRLSLGKVRLMDLKGRVIDSPAHDDVNITLLTNQKVTYNPDGTSRLQAQGAWDSSLHDSLFLNRITAPNSRVVLHASWSIQADKCEDDVKQSMDIAVQILGRDTGKSFNLRNLLNPPKALDKCSGIFLVSLRPPPTRTLSDLWRLNTAHKYVRGEEFLGKWRPRGVSLVNDFTEISRRIQAKEAVSVTDQILLLHDTLNGYASGEQEEIPRVSEEELLRHCITLWTRRFGTADDLVISQERICDMPRSNGSKPVEPETKLIADSELISRNDTVSKKGYLLSPEVSVAEEEWLKKWVVIRRPYLYLYDNASESNEIGIINLASARIDYKKHLEAMLERDNIFALYTNNNAYMFQAPSRLEMIDWITKIDQFYPVQTLEQD